MSTQFYAQSEKDRWETPRWLTETIDALVPGGITTDPCAGPGTSIGREYNFTIEDDGLSQLWPGVVFCNPPFSQKSDWLEKAVDQYRSGVSSLVFVLTPDSTDTKSWWHEYIAGTADYVWFSRGRINFVNPDKPDGGSGATFGTAISIYGNCPENLLRWFSEEGHLVRSVTVESSDN
ncbi:DNA N-6-adenine-methyltransferase [Halorubrum halodurans]|uniref:Adenine methyltransferase n=1 Tax=Halorubrum halodurans TaxID=1383851 RepID=A0A256IFS3_9EURY|nr:DNA N-6-adenine-methyltransferase [Halorubrum halodurans]OYR54982.1 hypothetical protein DJ70_12660 [Halorubrum halodurans]